MQIKIILEDSNYINITNVTNISKEQFINEIFSGKFFIVDLKKSKSIIINVNKIVKIEITEEE